jgi:DNA-binding response OmpR family regulator
MARLLVVDDDERLLGLFRELLEEGGHKVRAAANVTAALDALGAELPDILIMDLRVPELQDGLRLLRSAPSGVLGSTMRVIVISGWTGDLAEHTERTRADRILAKPLRMEALLASIRVLTVSAADACL